MTFKLLVIKKDNVLHYRVVYQNGEVFPECHIRLDHFTAFRITNALCPELGYKILYLRSSEKFNDHQTQCVYKDMIHPMLIEEINKYFKLNEISNINS
jgi:hypothetical protein